MLPFFLPLIQQLDNDPFHLLRRVILGEVFAERIAFQRDAIQLVFLFFGHDLVHGVLRAFALTAELFQPLRLRKRGGVLGILHCIQKLPLFLRLEVRQLHSRIQGNFLGINFLLNLWNKLRQANEPLYLRNAFAAVLRDFFSGI